MLHKKKEVPGVLSKLFNIVLNNEEINSKSKIGPCKDIYDSYFSSAKNPSYKGAVNYYRDYISSNIKPYAQMFSESSNALFLGSIEYFKLASNISVKGSYERELAMNFLNGERIECRKIAKILLTFRRKSIRETLTNLEGWLREIKPFSLGDLNHYSLAYFHNLITFDSIVGTYIERDIKNTLSDLLNVKITDSSSKEDKLGIDGWIRDKAISVKSINYKNSPYRKSKKVDIRTIIGGAPIIFYKLDNSEKGYHIENLDEVIKFYSK